MFGNTPSKKTVLCLSAATSTLQTESALKCGTDWQQVLTLAFLKVYWGIQRCQCTASDCMWWESWETWFSLKICPKRPLFTVEQLKLFFGRLVPRLLELSPNNYRKPSAESGILQPWGTEQQRYVFNCTPWKGTVHLKSFSLQISFLLLFFSILEGSLSLPVLCQDVSGVFYKEKTPPFQACLLSRIITLHSNSRPQKTRILQIHAPKSSSQFKSFTWYNREIYA